MDADAEARARLGRAMEFDGLLCYLRAEGFPVSLAAEIRVARLLKRLAAVQAQIAGPDTATGWLAPLLASSQADRERLKRLIANWWNGMALDAMPLDPDRARLAAETRGRDARLDPRRALGRKVILVALLALIVGVMLIVGIKFIRITETVIPTAGPVLPLPDYPIGDSSRFWVNTVLPWSAAAAPFAAMLWLILRRWPAVQAVLRRRRGAAAPAIEADVPAAPIQAFRDNAARHAARAWRRPTLVRGTALDARRSINATLRAGGYPQVRLRDRARLPEYVLIVESEGAEDHLGLVANALAAALDREAVSYVRFAARGQMGVLAHAGGRRSGPVDEPLTAIATRFRGARLVVVGTGDTIIGAGPERPDRSGQSPFHSALASADFLAPTVLTPTPAPRWGAWEAALAAAGFSVEPLDAGGLRSAAERFALAESGDAQPPTVDVPLQDDPLMRRLRRDGLALLSHVSPPDRDVASLVRALRGYFADPADWRLFVALVIFPVITQDITPFLARVLEGRPLDGARLVQLARLPWFRAAHAPDWLRRGVLTALSPADEKDVRDGLWAAMRELGFEPAQPKDGSSNEARLAIMHEPSWRDRFSQWLNGGARGPVEAEALFLAFLRGEHPTALDQPVPVIPAGREWRQLGAAGAVVLAFLAWAWLGDPDGEVRDLWAWTTGVMAMLPSAVRGVIGAALLVAQGLLLLDCVTKPGEKGIDWLGRIWPASGKRPPSWVAPIVETCLVHAPMAVLWGINLDSSDYTLDGAMSFTWIVGPRIARWIGHPISCAPLSEVFTSIAPWQAPHANTLSNVDDVIQPLTEPPRRAILLGLASAVMSLNLIDNQTTLTLFVSIVALSVAFTVGASRSQAGRAGAAWTLEAKRLAQAFVLGGGLASVAFCLMLLVDRYAEDFFFVFVLFSTPLAVNLVIIQRLLRPRRSGLLWTLFAMDSATITTLLVLGELDPSSNLVIASTARLAAIMLVLLIDWRTQETRSLPRGVKA